MKIGVKAMGKKRSKKNDLNNNLNNNGSETVAASFVLPIFLFVMLAFVYIANMYSVRGIIYEGLTETAEEIAEEAYMGEKLGVSQAVGLPMAAAAFRTKLDSQKMVEKFVKGGIGGVIFAGSEFPNKDGDIVLKATYRIGADVPLISSFSIICTETIRQHAYIGKNADENNNETDDDIYVYVTDDGEVYHSSRKCTYLMPQISTESIEKAEASGLKKCRYCGERECNAESGGEVYVTKYGECYHTSKNCSRLARNVRRVKKKNVGLPPCSKCTDE